MSLRRLHYRRFDPVRVGFGVFDTGLQHRLHGQRHNHAQGGAIRNRQKILCSIVRKMYTHGGLHERCITQINPIVDRASEFIARTRMGTRSSTILCN